MIWKLLLFFGLIFTLNAKPFLDLDAPFDMDVSKLACEEGNATACVLLSLKYVEDSDSVSKDYTQAQKYMKKACDYGENKACRMVVSIKAGIEQEMLKQACDDGNQQACIDLKKTYYLVDGKCSKCGSTHIGHYAYGLIRPDEKMQIKIDKGEIILGGCMVSEDNPTSFYLDCGADLYDKKDD